MKYYIIEDACCYYVEKENNFYGDPKDIMATCEDEKKAKYIATACSEYLQFHMKENKS